MAENMQRARTSWIASFRSAQIGIFPLATPAGSLCFDFSDDSLATTSKQLRKGHFFQFKSCRYDGSTASEDISLQTHWQWLMSNVDESTALQAAVGLITPQSRKWALPVFTASIQSDEDNHPLGFLQIETGTRLNLNTTVVKILAKKYGVSPRWTQLGHTSEGFDLDALWEGLAESFAQTSEAHDLNLVSEVHVGLAPRYQTEILEDLRKHINLYSESPLVRRYATQAEPRPYPPTKYTDLDISKPIYAPLTADHCQLRVPMAFGRGESFILSGATATGKTNAVVNALAQGIVERRTTLVLGSKFALAQVKERMNRAGLGHLFLTLDAKDPDETARKSLITAWDNPVSANSEYLQSCRQSLAALSDDLDVYVKAIHEAGPNQLSAWDAYSATLLTSADLNAEERSLARQLVESPKFPYLPQQRIEAASYGKQLATLDSNSVGGISANPWFLAGFISRADKLSLSRTVASLETAITHAHPAVLEIMSACTSLQTWPLFARWLDLLEIGYGREPVELTERERKEVCGGIRELKAAYKQLLQRAKPLLDYARDAYNQEVDRFLLADARHAEASKGITRKLRLKSVLKELIPYLSTPISPNKLVSTLEDLGSLRQQSQELSTRISSNPMLGLSKFDALAPDAHEIFLRHADTVITAVELAAQLPNRQEDLISLIPIAREGGNLGKQVRTIAGAFAGILDTLKTQPAQLEKWAQSLPPLTRYLQVRKTWSRSLTSRDSALDDIVAFRKLEPKLREIGLEELSQWVEQGKLSGKSISGVLNYALSLSAMEERDRSLKQLSFSAVNRNSQIERLAATVAETRREISNVVQVCAADFAHELDKEQLRVFGAILREKNFSIAQALRQNLPEVLVRTPVLGLTPQQVNRYLPHKQSIFDALIVLESAEIPCGVAIRALSCSNQVLFIATTPNDRSFSLGRAPSAYNAAKIAGFPEMHFNLRYGTNLSPLTQLSADLLLPGQRTWPVPWRPESATVLTLDAPENPLFPLQFGDELPGWKGGGTSQNWFERAGNFLINVALKNKTSRIQALTLTGDLAAGIRCYIREVLGARGLALPNLSVSHLGDFHPSETQALVFFFGSTSVLPASKTGIQEDITTAFSRAILSTSHRLWLVENRGFDRLSLPDTLLKFVERVEIPRNNNLLNSNSSFAVEHLKNLLVRAGLEVQGPLGTAPLIVDLAVRGSAEAPWMGIMLDTPSWCGIPHTIDREVNFTNFLVQHCGFGQIEHVYLDQLINDEDDVTRRVVSLALDLAFPGEVTEGAVASEDRYSSPARVVAAQSQRIDSWELPNAPETYWNLPATIQKQPIVKRNFIEEIPGVSLGAKLPEQSLGSGSALTNIADSQSSQVFSGVETSLSDLAAENESASDEPLPPEFQIAAGIIATLNGMSAPLSTDEIAYSLTSPETRSKQILAGEMAAGKGLNTHSPVPIVFDIPETAFEHLTREDLEDVQLPEPTLSERLGSGEVAWITDITTTEKTGKISRPGYGAFAPLHIPSAYSETTEPYEKSESIDSKLDDSTVVMPQNTEFIPLSDAGEFGIKPFVPRGVPLHDLGQKQVLDDLDNPENASKVSAALNKILYTEGPISTSRLAKLVADAFGMQRLHSKRREKILTLLSPSVTIQSTKFGEFAWPEGTGSNRFNVFRTGSIYGQRSLTDICDEEFNNALTWVIATEHPSEDEASEAVARALDLTPLRTDIRSRMTKGIAKLEQEGRLERKDGCFYLEYT